LTSAARKRVAIRHGRWTLGAALWAGLVGCSGEDTARVTAPPEAAPASKAGPGRTWVARPHRFASGLRIGALAVTPDRCIATTLGPSPSKIVVLDEKGQPAPVAADFAAPAEAVCPLAVSPGLVRGFPQDEVFVGSGPDLWRLQPDLGHGERVATLPPEQGEIAGLCFDSQGSFTYDLLVLSGSGSVYRLAPTGELLWLADLGPGGRGPSVASSGFGAHAGQLLVAFPAANEVRAVSPEGFVTDVTGWSGVSAVAAIPDMVRAYGRSGDALFVAVESGEIWSFRIDDVAAQRGGVVMTSLYASGSGLALPAGSGQELRAWGRSQGPEIAAACVQHPAVTHIAVDVRPGTSLDTIEWGSTDPVPVGLLSSACFVPKLVDAATVLCAGAPVLLFGKATLGRFMELNGDGEPDLVLYFSPREMQLGTGAARLTLTGDTLAGDRIQGDASVQVESP
jgi:hypothetical protein